MSVLGAVNSVAPLVAVSGSASAASSVQLTTWLPGNDPRFLCLRPHTQVQATGSAPVLVLVANGSDITINFPGENNNNRLVSIVSASGNNNPSMVDWIGGNGANKAPSISLGRGLPPVADDSDSSEDSDPNRPRWSVAPTGGVGALPESDEAARTLPTVTATTVGTVTTTNATATIRNTTPTPTTVAAN
ncbi:uncharacterized protein LOC131215276 [Anopheles bellator]|uniref:uncharacterized protein LOC131215276 n=1 Tax=Anopheles bellator TaxID=139047 RepID=UPI0026492CE9|nr:uncharacterized protein LOC131215276 [Anopheles bellator]